MNHPPAIYTERVEGWELEPGDVVWFVPDPEHDTIEDQGEPHEVVRQTRTHIVFKSGLVGTLESLYSLEVPPDQEDPEA